ncbi:DNA replication factor C, large subunit [Eremomyces bilateralis CBS 781.70]|uniref:Replication factor C subunit 1 n=1 Tax=Eremomyces bilateralis CBS 781.70 TaxID=1392243 RepID=A0A6G1FU13_9PEZI|nr:DNA replication factor C, large subunit [Eremomyces bilateralis CBS 781.70]KAF1809182.1 DNA replication factor C, large subunit [Eremomyces bilateralis CBS 781.70]
MPSDIRSFFGGKAQSSADSKPSNSPAKAKSKSRSSKYTVDDSDEEVISTKTAAPKKAASKKQVHDHSPNGEATTTSAYFGDAKPKRSGPVKAASKSKDKPVDTAEKKNGTSTITRSGVTPKPSPYKKPKDRDEDFIDGDDGGDDVFTADYKKRAGRHDDYEEESEESDMEVVQPAKRGGKRSTAVKEEEDDDDDFEPPEKPLATRSRGRPSLRSKDSTPSKKRKSPVIEDDDDEEEDDEPVTKTKRGAAKGTPKKAPAKKKAKKEDTPEDEKVQSIYDSIQLVRPPTPPSRADGETGKFNFKAHAQNAGLAPAAGTRDIPTGAENCLAGLTFVFTGLLQYMERDVAQNLVKRHGGKVTTAPSGKTSYVVLGSDAGPKKLETIRKHNIKTINEDGLFDLIRKLPPHGGTGKAAAAFKEKQQAEEERIRKLAEEEEKAVREKEKLKKAEAAAAAASGNASSQPAQRPTSADLWTVKYAPTQLSQICGNKGQVEKLQRWLENFSKNAKKEFKMLGADGTGGYRAVCIHGPPGIGKTTAAHLVAKVAGFDVVESNASDTRSKRLVESGLRGVLDTTSVLGYFAGDGKKVETSKKKLVLIMDEVDGMSAGDRGGVGALAAVCRKTRIPIILICNERRQPKMKPLDLVAFDLAFRRPTVDQIRSRITTIAFREGIRLPPNVINALIEGSNADIRQVVNMVSTAKLDHASNDLDFDKSKEMSKAWEKHVILKPWDIVRKILAGGMFAPSSKSTLNDKSELYFNDHEFSPLMMQENYLGTQPIKAQTYQGRERSLKLMELFDQAAESISDGDMVDRMIHGSQQHWSLMPTHAMFSFVRPASFVSGSLVGHNTSFTQWLGKNSAQGKLGRMLREMHSHLRLRGSGDRNEVRMQYMPLLWQYTAKKMSVEGKDAANEVIDLLDSYFLTREDYEAIQELGIGGMDASKLKIDAPAKSAFTRLYNARSHPVPFMKPSTVSAPRVGNKAKPDLEEAIEESEDEALVDDTKGDDEDDLTKDKYIKAPKKKKAAAKGDDNGEEKGKGKAKGPAKKRARATNDDDEEIEEKPKKKTGRGRGKK